MPPHTRLIISILAVVSIVSVVAVLVAMGIHASNARELNQNEQIEKLKEALETQQTRLHRMQKELQFLVSRQQANDARDESLRRRQIRPAPASEPAASCCSGGRSNRC